MTCEWCDKAEATDARGLCADCRTEMELDKQIHYRFVQRKDAVGRIIWAVYTKTRKGTGWNYNQHVGNDNGRDNFVNWANKAGWIPEAV